MSLTDEQNPAKHVADGEEVLSKVLEETPGNPWKPFGNPSGNPWNPIGNPSETRKRFRHLAGLDIVPNPIPSNIA